MTDDNEITHQCRHCHQIAQESTTIGVSCISKEIPHAYGCIHLCSKCYFDLLDNIIRHRTSLDFMDNDTIYINFINWGVICTITIDDFEKVKEYLELDDDELKTITGGIQ